MAKVPLSVVCCLCGKPWLTGHVCERTFRESEIRGAVERVRQKYGAALIPVEMSMSKKLHDHAHMDGGRHALDDVLAELGLDPRRTEGERG